MVAHSKAFHTSLVSFNEGKRALLCECLFCGNDWQVPELILLILVALVCAGLTPLVPQDTQNILSSASVVESCRTIKE